VIQSWMNWRPLAASWIQEDDMVGRCRGENMGPIREHPVGAAQFQDTWEAESHVEETNREDRENGCITTR